MNGKGMGNVDVAIRSEQNHRQQGRIEDPMAAKVNDYLDDTNWEGMDGEILHAIEQVAGVKIRPEHEGEALFGHNLTQLLKQHYGYGAAPQPAGPSPHADAAMIDMLGSSIAR